MSKCTSEDAWEISVSKGLQGGPYKILRRNKGSKVFFILDIVKQQGSSTIGFLSNFCSETKNNYLGLIRKQSHLRM